MIEITNDVNATNGVTCFWAERQSVGLVYLASGEVKVIPLPEADNTKHDAVEQVKSWMNRNAPTVVHA